MGGILCAEPSAFELQSGATKQELNTLKNSNKNLGDILTTLKGQTDGLLQGQEGLRSLVEGQGIRLKKAIDALSVHSDKLRALKSTQETQADLIKQQADLINTLKAQIQTNQETLANFEKKNQETQKLLEDMRADFATKLQKLQKSIDSQANANNQKLKELVALQSQMLRSKKEQDFNKDPAQKEAIDKEAHALFETKRYQGAQERFAWLASLPYKSAYMNYMAGESAYFAKSYQSAINFFKKSAMLDDKTSYMPTLLYHTALAFKHIKNHANYKKFLQTLSRLYPESEQGKKAKNLLEQKPKKTLK
ncbi:Periplasmic protein [Helicobacter sp. NHP19-003]|uniref:Periplasmic protein n=1 Tax=Helicobacter gastrocanis TaxID=2849641 RepID=A0ABM7SAJ9_9HELI|nr:Periplasmic protein [Helicobacter sp. NHP19-003]